MTVAQLATLLVLALTDATSIGTLLVPLWLILKPRWNLRMAAVYLGMLAGFYLGTGVILLLAVTWGMPPAPHSASGPRWSWAGMILGGALVVWGLIVDRRGPTEQNHARVARWRTRALQPRNWRGMAILAMAAGSLELASMFPYLSAIGMIRQAALPLPQGSGVLLLYVIVMILPAAVLFGSRCLASRRTIDRLTQLQDAIEARSHMLWSTVLMAVGGLLAANCAINIGLLVA